MGTMVPFSEYLFLKITPFKPKMSRTMEKISADHQITGFRDTYNRLSITERRELKSKLGQPAKATFSRWLDDPGSIRLDRVTLIMEYLVDRFPDITLKSLCEIY